MIIYCDFSGVYAYNVSTFDSRISFEDISETNGYCSDEAAGKIRSRIKDFSADGVHIIDNGNHHYMSFFWIEKISEPFDLVVFDHHTDMQESALARCLSCGNWLMKAANNNRIHLNRIYLIGPHDADFGKLKNKYSHKIEFISETHAKKLAKYIYSNPNTEVFNNSQTVFPIYISVDKDALSETEVNVNWEQGNMALTDIGHIIENMSLKRKIIGIDICGEPDVNRPGYLREFLKSRNVDKFLIEHSFKNNQQYF